MKKSLIIIYFVLLASNIFSQDQTINGNLIVNADNSVATIKDDNIGLAKQFGRGGVWVVGSDYAHRFGKWSTPTLMGNIASGTFTEQMVIANNGYVGIGTTSPQKKLDVVGDASVSGTVFTNEIHFVVNGEDNSDPYTLRKVHDSENKSHLDLNLNDDSDESFRIYGHSCDGYGCGTYSGNLYHSFDASGNVYHSGSVGIGTTAPDQKLTVKGKIHAEEVIVDLSVPVADYVFTKDYELMPLHKLEQFVQENSHLPEIPSAAEVKENGLGIGEMQNKLLKKIEELTLYVIDLKKENEKQNKVIQELQDQRKTKK